MTSLTFSLDIPSQLTSRQDCIIQPEILHNNVNLFGVNCVAQNVLSLPRDLFSLSSFSESILYQYDAEINPIYRLSQSLPILSSHLNLVSHQYHVRGIKSLSVPYHDFEGIREVDTTQSPLYSESEEESEGDSEREIRESRIDTLAKHKLGVNRNILYDIDHVIQNHSDFFENNPAIVFLDDTLLPIHQAVGHITIQHARGLNVSEKIPRFIKFLAVFQREIKRISFYFGGKFIARGTFKAVYCFPFALHGNLNQDFELTDISSDETHNKVIQIWISIIKQDITGTVHHNQDNLRSRDALPAKYRLVSELVEDGSPERSHISLPEILGEGGGISMADRCDELFSDMIERIPFGDIYINTHTHIPKLINVLALLHQKGHIYSDIRSSNIMLKDNKVQIIDTDSVKPFGEEIAMPLGFPHQFYSQSTCHSGVFSALTDVFGISLFMTEMLLKNPDLHLSFPIKAPKSPTIIMFEELSKIARNFQNHSDFEKICLFLNLCSNVMEIDQKFSKNPHFISSVSFEERRSVLMELLESSPYGNIESFSISFNAIDTSVFSRERLDRIGGGIYFNALKIDPLLSALNSLSKTTVEQNLVKEIIGGINSLKSILLYQSNISDLESVFNIRIKAYLKILYIESFLKEQYDLPYSDDIKNILAEILDLISNSKKLFISDDIEDCTEIRLDAEVLKLLRNRAITSELNQICSFLVNKTFTAGIKKGISRKDASITILALPDEKDGRITFYLDGERRASSGFQGLYRFNIALSCLMHQEDGVIQVSLLDISNDNTRWISDVGCYASNKQKLLAAVLGQPVLSEYLAVNDSFLEGPVYVSTNRNEPLVYMSEGPGLQSFRDRTTNLLNILVELEKKKLIYGDMTDILFSGTEVVSALSSQFLYNIWSEHITEGTNDFFGNITSSFGILSPFTDVFSLSLIIVKKLLHETDLDLNKKNLAHYFLKTLRSHKYSYNSSDRAIAIDLLSLCAEVIEFDRSFSKKEGLINSTTEEKLILLRRELDKFSYGSMEAFTHSVYTIFNRP